MQDILIAIGFAASAVSRSTYRKQSYRAAKRFGEAYNMGAPKPLYRDMYGYVVDISRASYLLPLAKKYGGVALEDGYVVVNEEIKLKKRKVGPNMYIRNLLYDKVRGVPEGKDVWVLQLKYRGAWYTWDKENEDWVAADTPTASMVFLDYRDAEEAVRRSEEVARSIFGDIKPSKIKPEMEAIRGTVHGGAASPTFRDRPRKSSPNRRRYGKRRRRRRGFGPDSTFSVS